MKRLLDNQWRSNVEWKVPYNVHWRWIVIPAGTRRIPIFPQIANIRLQHIGTMNTKAIFGRLREELKR